LDQTEALLREITEAPGVPGYEGQVRAIIRRHLEEVTTIEQDKMGSIICKKAGLADSLADSPKVMLAGHMDEIGFMVKLITKEGFVKFVPLGGWWDQVMLAQRVVIKTAQGTRGHQDRPGRRLRRHWSQATPHPAARRAEEDGREKGHVH